MAGFGGGRKSILPGIAGYETIQANHNLLLKPESKNTFGSGKLKGNPIHEDMMEACQMVKPTYLLNVVMGSSGKVAKVVGGKWDTAWEAGCKAVEENFGIELSNKGDLVIASAGGCPKDMNLYQSSKALDNAFYATKENGTIILLTESR
ncbi:MAG: lactate racemase domain-containing protein, partial [Phormidium sp.]